MKTNMKAQQAQSARINEMAIAAKNDQSQYSQLFEVLNAHKSQSISKFSAKYPSVDRDDLESAYLDVVWREASKYDVEKGDFLAMVNRAMTYRAIDLLRRCIGKKLRTESLDAAFESQGDAAFSEYATQPDAVTFINEAHEEVWLDEQLDAYGIEGANHRAITKTRYYSQSAHDEIVSIADGIYRNRQQVWRDSIGHARNTL